MPLLRFTAAIIKFLFWLLACQEIVGLENVPKEGPLILVVNHLGYLDAPFVYVNFPRKDITALAAKKYQNDPFMRWLVNLVGGIWVDRAQPGPEAIRELTKFLRSGGILSIAPEGTRSSAHTLLRGKPGVAYLATRAKVPILPCAITGTENAISTLFRFRRPTIGLKIGEPFMLEPISRKNRDADLQARADEIMCQVANLLPPQYHGVYRNHPGLGKQPASLLEDPS